MSLTTKRLLVITSALFGAVLWLGWFLSPPLVEERVAVPTEVTFETPVIATHEQPNTGIIYPLGSWGSDGYTRALCVDEHGQPIDFGALLKAAGK